MAASPLPFPSVVAGRIARVEREDIRGVLEECLSGEASPPISLARLLLGLDRVDEAEELLRSLLEGGAGAGTPLAELARLLREHRDGCAAAQTILHEHPELDGRFRRGAIEESRRFFDRAVALNEEASVAAYSLGDPALLDAFTREIVDVLEAWSVLGTTRSALEIGCGIGRVLSALAPRLREIHGIDISPGMAATARRRCADVANVRVSVCSGRDLSGVQDGRFDLVLAVDSFPYIFPGGRGLVETHFREVARVLRPGGDFVVFNFSYRPSREADRLDVRRLCRKLGLETIVPGAQPFRLWDADAFHLRRPG